MVCDRIHEFFIVIYYTLIFLYIYWKKRVCSGWVIQKHFTSNLLYTKSANLLSVKVKLDSKGS